MLKYIEGNILFTEEFFANLVADSSQSDSCNKQLIIPIRPQSSFLVWLDCRNLCSKLGLSHEDLVDLFVNKAKLALNSGVAFGPGGEGFMRLNVGSSRELLARAYTQLKEQILSLLK
jgi:cystathionine beta-lyase